MAQDEAIKNRIPRSTAEASTNRDIKETSVYHVNVLPIAAAQAVSQRERWAERQSKVAGASLVKQPHHHSDMTNVSW